MKKLILGLFVAIGTLSLVASDQYLMWMIDSSDYDDSNINPDWEAWTTGSAKIYASDGSSKNYLNIYSTDTTGTGSTQVNMSNGSGVFAADISGYASAGWSYYVEVYNSDGGWNGMSEGGLTYANASDGEYIAMGKSEIYTGATIYNFALQTYTAAPEPNSAMLLLIGLSALALRRKRAAKKA